MIDSERVRRAYELGVDSLLLKPAGFSEWVDVGRALFSLWERGPHP